MAAPAPAEVASEQEKESDATADQIRGSTLLLVGRGLAVGLNFLTQVLTVRYLAKDQYGALAYALALASFLGHLSRVGMDKGVSRYAAIEDERADYARMFGTLVFAFGLVLAFSTGVVLLVKAFGGSVGPALVSDPLSLQLLLILVALAPLEALDVIVQSVYAIFSKPRLIFFRKYIVAPGLKLVAVIVVMLLAGDARTLAYAHLVGGALGLVIGASLAGQVFRERDLLRRFRWRGLEVRARELLGFGLPMMGSDAVALLRGVLVVFLLEFIHGAMSVADFRAVLPVARVNSVALDAFVFLFIPAVARLTAQNDARALNDLYWRSTTWVTMLSLPTFLVTACLARPVTLLLFGERYAGAAPVLALLSVGSFIYVMLAMSGHALKAVGRVRELLRVDFTVLSLGILLTLLLIPRFGAMGGAAAYAITSITHAGLYQVMLARSTGVRLLPVGFGRLYAYLLVVVGVVFAIGTLLSPPLWVGVILAAVAWLVVLVRAAEQLQVDRTFPELLRVPVLGRLLEARLDRTRRRGGSRVPDAPANSSA